MMLGRERWMGVLVLVVVVGALVAPSRAQQFSLPMAVGEAFQPDYYRRDLTAIVEELQLDAQQRAVVESLYADYDAEFRKSADAAREQMQALVPLTAIDEEARAMREEQIRARVAELMDQVQKMRTDMPLGEEGDALRKDVQERAAAIRQEIAALNPEPISGEELRKALLQSEGVLAAWQAEKDRMRNAFDSGVQAIATEEQRPRWSSLDRRLRRDKSLGRGRLSGESVNILLIVKQLPLHEEARAVIAEDLASYELRLDGALRAREEHLKRANLDLLKAMHDQDRGKAESVASQLVRSRVAVRDVNDDTAKTIAAKLPADPSAEFLSAFRDRGYARVYRTTGTQRLLNAAQEIPGLDSSLVDAVAELEKSYLLELAPSNERLLAAIRAAEPVEMEKKLVRSTVGGEETLEPPVQQMEAEFDARLLLGKRVEAQLESLLGAENWAKLPHRRSGGSLEDEN